MLRLSRLADYAVVVMSHLATRPSTCLSAGELADWTRLPLPTVRKVLKLLSRAELVVSQRGVNGGYSMARPAEQITLADMVHAVEGPLVLADCVAGHHEGCELELTCRVAPRWSPVNDTIEAALAGVSLSQLM
jgi:FeS assembly SUF system regulator